MNLRHIIRSAALGLVAGTAITGASATAQDYPSDTVRIVVPWRAGGGTDSIARGLAKAMETQTSQAVLVENLTGGMGNRAHMYVKDVAPDGLTMLFNGSSDLTSLLAVNKLPYALDDYACIGGVYETPTWAIAHKDTGFKTLDDLIEFAKANPGKVVLGSGAKNTTQNLMARAIIGVKGLDARVISFDGGASMRKAVLANQVSAVMIHAPVMLDAIKAGEVNVLVAGGSVAGISYEPARSVKTLRDYGIPYDFGLTRGLLAPKDTPPEILAQASKLVETAAKSPEFAEFGAGFGFAPVWKDSATFCAQLREEVTNFQAIAKDFQ